MNNVFEEVNYDLLETFYNGLNQNDKIPKRQNFKEYAPIKIGAKVGDFLLPDVNKKPKNLYKNLGKYTIIDFWASWCAPCCQETPSTVELYNKYRKNGLKIIGISLDTDKQKWIGAIEKDNLTWLQLSNLTGWKEPLLQYFKVRSIPKLIYIR